MLTPPHIEDDHVVDTSLSTPAHLDLAKRDVVTRMDEMENNSNATRVDRLIIFTANVLKETRFKGSAQVFELQSWTFAIIR